MDEELDDALESAAARLGVSKASLIRSAVAKEFGRGDAGADDPWLAMVGRFQGKAVDDDDIDEVVYGRKARRL
jgi:hypothetical protein